RPVGPPSLGVLDGARGFNRFRRRQMGGMPHQDKGNLLSFVHNKLGHRGEAFSMGGYRRIEGKRIRPGHRVDRPAEILDPGNGPSIIKPDNQFHADLYASAYAVDYPHDIRFFRPWRHTVHHTYRPLVGFKFSL